METQAFLRSGDLIKQQEIKILQVIQEEDGGEGLIHANAHSAAAERIVSAAERRGRALSGEVSMAGRRAESLPPWEQLHSGLSSHRGRKQDLSEGAPLQGIDRSLSCKCIILPRKAGGGWMDGGRDGWMEDG